MEFRVLAIGDVTSEEGTAHLRRHLPGFKKMKGVDFTVINGENISGTGLTPQQADDLFAAGADVITLGNHTWGKMQITDYLEDNRYILRPANFSPRTPGRGYGVYDLGRVQVAVMVLIGRCDLAWGSDNPFTTADRLLKAGDKPTFTLVDFHAQATSEKLAMAYYLDGRVSALWGTHTHVPTADERVFPHGTGYITDLGMTGAVESVLGIRPEQITISREKTDAAQVEARVYAGMPAGSETLVSVRVGEKLITVKELGSTHYAGDETVYLSYPPKKVNVFDASTKRLIKYSR